MIRWVRPKKRLACGRPFCHGHCVVCVISFASIHSLINTTTFKPLLATNPWNLPPWHQGADAQALEFRKTANAIKRAPQWLKSVKDRVLTSGDLEDDDRTMATHSSGASEHTPHAFARGGRSPMRGACHRASVSLRAARERSRILGDMDQENGATHTPRTPGQRVARELEQRDAQSVLSRYFAMKEKCVVGRLRLAHHKSFPEFARVH